MRRLLLRPARPDTVTGARTRRLLNVTTARRVRPTRFEHRRRLAALGGLVGLAIASSTTAAVTPAAATGNGPTTTAYHREDWGCGYRMDVTGTSSDKVQLRTDPRIGTTYFSDVYNAVERWKTPDGRSFSLSWNGMVKDLQGRRVQGTVYEFTFQRVGQPIVITDSSGQVVSRDRGNLSFTYTVDVADGSFVQALGLKVAGPHPMAGQDLCVAVRPLTGGDSYRYLTPRPIGSTDSPMGYDEYLPPSYHASGPPSPLLVALNGYGQNGDGTPAGLQVLVDDGIPRFINTGAWPTDRPLVVLAPQHVEQPGFDGSPCDGVWEFGSCNMMLQDQRGDTQPAICTTADEVHAFISYALTHYNVDPTRVYLTGLSCGGFGAWEYLAKYGGQQVAAAVPVAGEGRPAWARAGCGLSTVPIWGFTSTLDDVVDPQGTITTMTNIQGCPGATPSRARLTVYPELHHEAWNPAYDGQFGDDIYSWMLGFTRP
jgi:dienelactone hydrolase